MADTPVAAAVYDTHAQAEDAIRKLQHAGFDMKSLSIVGKDYSTEEHAIGFYNTGDRVKVWGKLGAFWGGLLGVLFSPAFFLIPGIGGLIVLGPFAAAIFSALEGAVVTGGAGALAGALAGIGVPKDSVVRYETQVKAGKFLVIAHGTAEQVAAAHSVLKGGATEVMTHAA